MEKLNEAIVNKAKDGRITCKDARQIADELGIDNLEVGKKINELKIKITKCELGCF
ncbi:MAG: hypothetical protein SVR08_00500 [Spirochaetota bacterium]|nr:hypothetical protein [Spirochaetota bacterium]